jgi:hypothetical protein
VSFIQKVPLRRFLRARPLPGDGGPGPPSPFGQPEPSGQSRSALVVSHHLDGFLRARSRGLVASRFDHGVRRVSSLSRPRGHHRPSPAALVTPSEAFPSPTAASRHPRSTGFASRLDSACFPRFTGSPGRYRVLSHAPASELPRHHSSCSTSTRRWRRSRWTVTAKALPSCRFVPSPVPTWPGTREGVRLPPLSTLGPRLQGLDSVVESVATDDVSAARPPVAFHGLGSPPRLAPRYRSDRVRSSEDERRAALHALALTSPLRAPASFRLPPDLGLRSISRPWVSPPGRETLRPAQSVPPSASRDAWACTGLLGVLLRQRASPKSFASR